MTFRHASWLAVALLIGLGAVQPGCARGSDRTLDGRASGAEPSAGSAPATHASSDGRGAVPDASFWLPPITTVPHQLEGSTQAFEVAARTPSIRQYPCSSCHRAEAPAPLPSRPDRPERAHWRIVDAHGSADGFTCASCHDPREPQRLRDVHGREMALDHSYLLCGACHFQQLRDWEGGAHGKRLAIWSGPRVIEACAGCHDPHRPDVEVRTPSAHSPLPVRGGAR